MCAVVNSPYHHFSRKSSTMSDVMSNLMHETLLKSLLSNNSPDSRRHSLVVYFLAIEDYTPTLYFYELIECSIDQSIELNTEKF